MATTQPERIKSMILFCPTPYFPDQARQFMQGMTYESAEPTYLEMLHMRHPAGEDQIRALFNQFQKFALDFDDMNFTPAKLSTIKAHTLIIHGDRDEFFPISLPVDMYQAIPQSSLWIVPNAGHANLLESINVGSESMDEFPKLALEFLRSNLRSTS
jgi:pimeloyl-ACP methyl ester carboxylesterase